VADDVACLTAQRYQAVLVVVVDVDEALRGPRKVLDRIEEAEDARLFREIGE